MNSVLDRLHSFLAVVVGVILVFMTLTIGYAIFARAVGLPGPVWIVQFNEYAMLFATFMGSSWLLSKGRHVSIELMVSRMGPKNRKILSLIHSLVGAVLCGTLCWYSAITTIDHYQRNVMHVQAVDVPMAYVLFIIPVGFFLLVVQFLRNLIQGALSIRNPGPQGSPGSKKEEEASIGGGH
jgi:C4-dicarboxylate transporter, DctQ subunit